MTAPEQVEDLGAARGLQHDVSAPSQMLQHQPPDGRVIVGDQDPLAGGRRHGTHGRARDRIGRRILVRQVDVEGRAAPGARLHRDETAELLHEAVHRRQSEAGTLTRILGREERLEDVRQHIGWNATPGVPHAQQREATGARGR